MLGGKNPINVKYAGEAFPLPDELASYPGGVRFTDEGFPDFTPHASKQVEISPHGPTRAADFARSNQAAGQSKTLCGFTWHHAEDGSMQLIPTDLHEAVRHSGGVAVNKARGVEYR